MIGQEKCRYIFKVIYGKWYHYGFSRFSILIGWQAARKNPYPDRDPYFQYLSRRPRCPFIQREIFALQREKIFDF
jgi:hypothetical protein